jgi:hypothetical protein
MKNQISKAAFKRLAKNIDRLVCQKLKQSSRLKSKTRSEMSRNHLEACIWLQNPSECRPRRLRRFATQVRSFARRVRNGLCPSLARGRTLFLTLSGGRPSRFRRRDRHLWAA